MKGKLIVISLLACLTVLAVGVTYSRYVATGTGEESVAFAKFVFEAEETTKIELPLLNLIPGSRVEHEFSVSNNLNTNLNEVVFEYEITLKTQLLIPLTYQLYSTDGTETLILTCDSTVTRDPDNLIVCTSPVYEMTNVEAHLDNYRLDIIFPAAYTDPIYSDLVDYIDVEINSWQKL